MPCCWSLKVQFDFKVLSRGVDNVSVDFGTTPLVAGEEPVVPMVELLRSGFAVIMGLELLQALNIRIVKTAGIILRIMNGVVKR